MFHVKHPLRVSWEIATGSSKSKCRTLSTIGRPAAYSTSAVSSTQPRYLLIDRREHSRRPDARSRPTSGNHNGLDSKVGKIGIHPTFQSCSQ